jgi:DNA-binding CsgD family transcriptional regulator
MAVLLLAASTALLAFITPRCDTLENKPVMPVKEFFRKAWHLDIVIGVVNMTFGYAFIMLYHVNTFLLVAAMALAFLVNLVFSIALGRGKWILLAGSLRICVAFAGGALLLLACPNDITQAIALCTLVMFWFVFRTMNSGSLNDLANHYDFSILYSSTRGKLPTNMGFLAGLVIGIVVIGGGSPEAIRLYVPLSLVALLMLSALFLLPFDNESSTAGYKTLALVDMHENPNADMSEVCDTVTKRFKLSPRESEVLVYLVKGRNAKHVSEKLFISESTVKTHISNIYRKVGVHSQQELLDALEYS